MRHEGLSVTELLLLYRNEMRNLDEEIKRISSHLRDEEFRFKTKRDNYINDLQFMKGQYRVYERRVMELDEDIPKLRIKSGLELLNK